MAEFCTTLVSAPQRCRTFGVSSVLKATASLRCATSTRWSRTGVASAAFAPLRHLRHHPLGVEQGGAVEQGRIFTPWIFKRIDGDNSGDVAALIQLFARTASEMAAAELCASSHTREADASKPMQHPWLRPQYVVPLAPMAKGLTLCCGSSLVVATVMALKRYAKQVEKVLFLPCPPRPQPGRLEEGGTPDFASLLALRWVHGLCPTPILRDNF